MLSSGKWVIIDLSSGGSDDVISFVGTILINMVYVEAKKRFARAHSTPRPFFMYVDEAHLFAPFVLRELLNTMRKANVKVTITSQTIMNAMTRNGIDGNLYKIVQILPDTVERLSNLQNDSVAHPAWDELEVYNALGEGRTASSVAERVNISSYDVMGILWKLEQKGLAERGYAETKKSTVDLALGRSTVTTKREEYFVPTKNCIHLEQPMPNAGLPDSNEEDRAQKGETVTQSGKDTLEYVRRRDLILHPFPTMA